MALLMERGGQALTEEEKADLEGIEALRESAVNELKEEGNEFLKQGKKHYSDAMDCYTRALNQKSKNVILNSVLYANRAQCNLLLGNYRHAITDAEAAARLNPANIKAYFRRAKASIALGLWFEAAGYCYKGLQHDPLNEELKKLGKQAEDMREREAEHKKRSLESKSKVEALLSAIKKRHLRIGESKYRQHTGLRRPWLDSSGIIHWPVVLLYGEVMSSDLIEDFAETDTFKPHIETMFGKNAPPLMWDAGKDYTSDRVELYYQSNVGPVLSRKQLLQSLMEGEVGLDLSDASEDVSGTNEDKAVSENRSLMWVKVNEKSTLHEVLSYANHIIPGIPAFYVVATGTNFHELFLKKWTSP